MVYDCYRLPYLKNAIENGQLNRGQWICWISCCHGDLTKAYPLEMNELRTCVRVRTPIMIIIIIIIPADAKEAGNKTS